MTQSLSDLVLKDQELDLAHKMTMTDDLRKIALMNRNMIAKQTGQKEEEASSVGDLILGDVTHTTTQAAPSTSLLPKLLLGAGLIASGVGMPVGAGILASALSKPVTSPIPVPTAAVNSSSTQTLDVDMIVDPP